MSQEDQVKIHRELLSEDDTQFRVALRDSQGRPFVFTCQGKLVSEDDDVYIHDLDEASTAFINKIAHSVINWAHPRGSFLSPLRDGKLSIVVPPGQETRSHCGAIALRVGDFRCEKTPRMWCSLYWVEFQLDQAPS